MFPTVASVTPDSSEPLRRLPRGPHRLAREVIEASQRGRLLDAMAQVVSEKGYLATTVADVIAHAGVSRRTFYEHFRDKEDCFLAAYDTGVEVLLDTVRQAGEGIEDPLERTRARVRAYLETLAAEPAFARTFEIEIAAAGPRAQARRREVYERFAAVAREDSAAARRQLPGLPDPPDDVYLAAVGATDAVVSARVAEGRIEELGELEPVVLHIQLALIVGIAPPAGD
jgi:AcrR family transcriptional regulator